MKNDIVYSYFHTKVIQTQHFKAYNYVKYQILYFDEQKKSFNLSCNTRCVQYVPTYIR